MSGKPSVKWTIKSRETGITVVGQFPADVISQGPISSVFGDITSVNQSQPITQWLRGNLDTMSFQSLLMSKDNDHDIKSKWDSLKKLARRDSNLKRLPVCIFTVGQHIALVCYLESISNIQLKVRNSGKLNKVDFTLTLRRYTPNVQQPTDPNKPESLSRGRRSKQGESYESIAADEYGHAIYGDVLRRYHRYKPDLEEGDRVHVLPLLYVLRQKKLEPQAPILNNDAVSKTHRDDLFASRSTELRIIS